MMDNKILKDYEGLAKDYDKLLMDVERLRVLADELLNELRGAK